MIGAFEHTLIPAIKTTKIVLRIIIFMIDYSDYLLFCQVQILFSVTLYEDNNIP